jgi:hypothetical protein
MLGHEEIDESVADKARGRLPGMHTRGDDDVVQLALLGGRERKYAFTQNTISNNSILVGQKLAAK